MEERQFIMCYSITKGIDVRIGINIVRAKNKWEAMGILMDEFNKKYPGYNCFINPSMASVDTNVNIKEEN